MKKRVISFLLSFIMIVTLVSSDLQILGKESDKPQATTQANITEDSSTEAVSTEDDSTEAVSTGDDNTEAVSTGDDNTEAVSTGDNNTEAASTEDDNTEAVSTENGNTEAVSTEDASEESSSTEEAENFTMDSDATNSYEGIGAEADGLFLLAASDIEEGYADYSDYLTNHTILVDGTPYNGTDRLNPTSSFTQHLEFTLSRKDMKANGIRYYFPMPENISIGNVGSATKQIPLYNTIGRIIGVYFIKNDVIYVTFPGYYEKVTAYFNLNASWEGIDNKSNTEIEWPGEKEKVYFDLSALNISKAISSFRQDEEGNTYAVFTVRISPKREDLALTDVKFEDKYVSSAIVLAKDYYTDTNGNKKDIQIKTYRSDGSLTDTSWYSYSDVAVTSGTTTNMTITGLTIPSNGYVTVQYAVKVDNDAYMKLNSKGTNATYDNTAKASYNVYNDDGTINDTLSASVKKEGSYGTATKWIYKSVGTGVYTNDKTNLVVPYTVGINRDRLYSLGGSVVHDSITQYDKTWTVTYDMTSNPTVAITDKNGGSDRTLEWRVLPDELYADFVKVINRTSKATAMENILTGTGDYAALREKLKTELGVSELTNEIVSTYLFTDSKACDFSWIVPLDEMPTHYMLHYNTLVPSKCGGNSNSASMWYTEYEARPGGPGSEGIYYDNPYAKVMEIDKSNDGVYEDGKGNYFVDWHISITVPAGSSFDHIMLCDDLPEYYVSSLRLNNPRTLTKYVYDWLCGVSEDELKQYKRSGSSEKDRELAWNLSDKIFTVTADSTDPEIQNVVNNLKGQPIQDKDLLWSGVVESQYNYSAKYGKTTVGSKGISSNHIGCYNNEYYFREAGQIKNGTESGSYTNLYFYLDKLPLSDKDYTINIDYTLQVNPLLVEELPNLLGSRDYITLTNRVKAYQMLDPEYTNLPRRLDSDSKFRRIGMASASYQIGKKDIDANILKDVTGYDEESKVIDYTVRINPLESIASAHTEYQLEDIISFTGATYNKDSFVLKDGEGEVIWSTDTDVTVAEKYKDYAGYIKLAIDNKTDGSSSFVITLDNTAGTFDGVDGKLLRMDLDYSVEAPTYETCSELQNTVNLIRYEKVSGSEKNAKIIEGSATNSFTYDKALDKEQTVEPTPENNYKASFEVLTNLRSGYAAELGLLNPGDTFTIKDKLSSNLMLDIDSIKVLYFDTVTETYKDLDMDSYDLRYDKDTNSIYATITIQNGANIYKLSYDVHVKIDFSIQSWYDTPTTNINLYSNEASILNSSVESDIISDGVRVQTYNQGADATLYKIRFVKYDGNNLNKRLGAAFYLYYWDRTSRSWKQLVQDSGDIFRTDPATGILTLSNDLCSLQQEQLITKNTWYKLVEVKSPTGYMLEENPIYYYTTETGESDSYIPSGSNIKDYTVVTIGQEEPNELYIPNEKLNFRLSKVDAIDNSILLSGAEFAVYSDEACTNHVQTLMQDGNMYMASDLDIGDGDISYYLKETKSPKGYKLNETVYEVRVEDAVLKYIKSLDGTDTLKLDAERISYLFGNDSIYGKLKLSKRVSFYSSSDTEKDEAFAFSIVFRDENGVEIEDALPYEFTDETGTVTAGSYYSGDVIYLKQKEALYFTKLEEGTSYRITETSDINYKPEITVTDTAGTDSKRSYSGTEATGTIEGEEADNVSYNNKYYSNLTVRKSVISDEDLTIPDGFTISVYKSNKRNLYAKGRYDAAQGIFTEVYTEDGMEFVGLEDGYTIRGMQYGNVYCYIKEENADITGYDYTVAASQGTLQPDKSIYTNVYKNTVITLTNTYTRSSDAYAKLEARKRLDGRDLKPGDFTFALYDDEDELIEEVTNGQYGVIKFSPLTYSEAGTYNYTIKEVVPQEAVLNDDGKYTCNSVTYTNDVIDVTVEVSYDNDNHLTADVAYSINGAESNTFVNTYKASGRATVTGRKVLIGRSIGADEFTFSIRNADGEIVSTGKADAAGEITFTDILYDESDIGKTYTYTVTEDNTAIPGIVYSEESYTVKVSVKDNRDGTLAVATSYGGAAESNIVFNNNYKVEKKVVFTALKSLEGRDLTKGQFNFRILDEQNEAVATGTNDADGNIIFSGITYYVNGTENNMGSHTYKIVEIDDAAAGYTYDSTAYNITVTATDNKNGAIDIEVTGATLVSDTDGAVTYKIEPEAGREANFINSYSASGGITFAGTKTVENLDKMLKNNKLEKGEFTFTVTEKVGNRDKVVATGENDANGSIVFTRINYNQEDIGTHIYTITEDEDHKVSNILYDEEAVTVMVEVSDAGDGTVTATAKYIKAEKKLKQAEFTNSSTEISVLKTDEKGNPLVDAELCIYDEKGEPVTTITSTEELQVIYGLDTGTTYTLRELKAPTGYKTASDIRFKLKADGTLIVDGNEVEYIQMVDEKLTITETDTGDNSNYLLAMILLVISVFGAGILSVYRKKAIWN